MSELGKMQYDQYIEHEVQIRVLESKHSDIYKKFDDIDKKFDTIDRKFDAMDAKIDSRFMLMIGLILTSIILPVVLHSLKLV